MTTDTAGPSGLTIIRARGRRLCKLVRADGTAEGYDAARTLDLFPVAVDGLGGLAALLRALADQRDRAVVRGAPADPRRTGGVRRLLHRDPATGDAPTLRDAPRSWVALDLDGMPLPAGCDPSDLAACGEAARAALPQPFRAAACVVGATASHGLKPGARLRLWAWLSRPLTGADCRTWLRGQPGCDPSTLGAAQPIYTAVPLFEGREDPLPLRLAELPGGTCVPCPPPSDLLPRPRPQAEVPHPVGDPGSYVFAALARAATAIATARVDSRHPTAVREAWGLARFVHRGALGEDELVRTVEGALLRAGKPAGEGEAIARWAVARRADGGTTSPAAGR